MVLSVFRFCRGQFYAKRFVENRVCFLHCCGPCVGNVFGSILEQISTDFGCFFGVGKGILERLVEVVCEGRVLRWILKFLGRGSSFHRPWRCFWAAEGEKCEKVKVIMNWVGGVA